MCRIEGDRSSQQLHGSIIAPCRGMNLRRRCKRSHTGWIEKGGDRILGQRLVETILSAIHVRQIEVCGSVVGRQANAPRVRGHGSIEIELIVPDTANRGVEMGSPAK